MNETNQKFQVMNENGEIEEAELITIVDIDNKKYAVYSIDNNDETVDILASYLEKDDEGYDKLVDIDNELDKEKVANFIKSLVS